MNGLTICAANYLPFAKTLANSFLKFHPKSKFYLLLVDGDVSEVTNNLGPEITVIKPSDLDLDPDVFMRMAIYYDVTELSTALKPLGLKYLLDTGSEIAIYLDPDIEVFSELVEIPKHPFFIGVQFHPELKSTVENPHPIFVKFIKKAIEIKSI